MKKNISTDLTNEAVTRNFDTELAKKIKKEIQDGIDTDDYNITSFKVEQKILNMTNSNSLKVGGFVNGSSSVSKFSTRYLLVMYSNKFKILKDANGNVIRKRYGYGIGFTLTVTDIETEIGFDYGTMAASAALNFANIGYELNIYGVEDADFVKDMPSRSGSFTKDVYEQLTNFIDKVKTSMSKQQVNKLYPIEMLRPITTNKESMDAGSIYFGAKKVSEGHTLDSAIKNVRAIGDDLNENVIQYMYSYFGLKNAYTLPNMGQKENARNWMKGEFNKVEELKSGRNSWVDIDPETDDEGNYIALAHLENPEVYRPHPLPTNWSNAGKAIDDIYSEVSMDFSTSLKVASMVDASGKFNTVTFTRNLAMYIDVSDNTPEGSKVIETRYGVGVRLKLHVSKIEFGTEVTYATIGAVSELGHANVELEISGFGIPDQSILEVLPKPQSVSEDTMTEIDNAFTAIREKLADMDMSELEPQPYKIRVNEPDKIDPTLHAQAVAFSMRKVGENRVKLKDAIKKGRDLGLNVETIKSVYADEFEITDENIKPTFPDKKEAREWLHW